MQLKANYLSIKKLLAPVIYIYIYMNRKFSELFYQVTLTATFQLSTQDIFIAEIKIKIPPK